MQYEKFYTTSGVQTSLPLCFAITIGFSQATPWEFCKSKRRRNWNCWNLSCFLRTRKIWAVPKFVRLRKSEGKQNHMELHEWCQPWVASATSVVGEGKCVSSWDINFELCETLIFEPLIPLFPTSPNAPPPPNCNNNNKTPNQNPNQKGDRHLVALNMAQ